MSAQSKKPQLNSELLRQRLKLRSISSERKLLESHSTAREFFEKIGFRPGRIRSHAAKLLTTGALAGTLLLSVPPPVPLTGHNPLSSSPQAEAGVPQAKMAGALKNDLPPVGEWSLTPKQENKISQEIKDIYGLKAKAELDGVRLPNSYGRMGAEQHLPRYPGDTISQHEEYQDKGITPGLGGWGYFAYSQNQMTPELYETEKYYVAVQSIYIPDWKERLNFYIRWFKYRRVLVINPANGKAVVAAVADAGPSWWTGKHFGGSPEIMGYLGINYGMQNHPVVLFFLDDPQKEIPLGPLEYNVEKNKELLANQS